MNESEPCQWGALHIHYRAPQDTLLDDGVRPLVDRLTSSGTITGFFFLRYWRDGPHIRLRLRAPAHRGQAVLDAASSAMSAYVSAHPSTTPLTTDLHEAAMTALATLEGEPPSTELIADNTVLVRAYEPEPHKYGGTVGVTAAEHVFEASSRSVLAALSNPERRTGRRLLGLGSVTMLRLLNAAALSPAEQVNFLGAYERFWSRYVLEGAERHWPRRYDEHASTLDAQIVQARSPAPDSPTRNFVEKVGELMDAVARDPLRLAAITAAGPDADTDRRRAYLLLNLVHTHNNRLGITPAHEAYLAYLARRAVAATGIAPVDPLPARI